MPSTATSLLNGKILKQSLSVIRGRPAPDAPRLKRLLLGQGELSHFWDGEEPIHYIAFVELREGAVRGNHYHLVKHERFYVISGEVSLVVEERASGARESVLLQAGDLAEISTGVAHAFRTVVPGQAVEFSNARFDAGDVYAFPLI